MNYETYEHRHALTLFEHENRYIPLYNEIKQVLDGISEFC